MDEIAEHLKAVLLLDLFLLEELGDLCDTLPDFLKLSGFLLLVLLELLDAGERLLHVTVALLELAFKVLGHLHDIISLLHQVIDLVLEVLNFLGVGRLLLGHRDVRHLAL